MKKFIFLILLLTANSAFAKERYAILHLGAGKFTDHIVEEIYPHWHPDIGIELGFFYTPCLSFSAGYSYMHTTGRSIILDPPPLLIGDPTHSTEITLHNFDFLAHWFFRPHKSIRPHIGIGPRVFFVSIHDHSPFVVPNPRQSSLGGVVVAGVSLEKGCFFLDPFFEYAFTKINFHNNESSFNYPARLNNFSVGIGIGMKI